MATYTLFTPFGRLSDLEMMVPDQTEESLMAQLSIVSSRISFNTEKNHRPSLVLNTKITNDGLVRANGDRLLLGDGENNMIYVFNYEFSDEQLSNLCLKGFFHKGFSLPEILKSKDTKLELPIKFNLGYVDSADGHRVFYGTPKEFYVPLNQENSEYDLSAYFEKQIFEEVLGDYDYTASIETPVTTPVVEPEVTEEKVVTEFTNEQRVATADIIANRKAAQERMHRAVTENAPVVETAEVEETAQVAETEVAENTVDEAEVAAMTEAIDSTEVEAPVEDVNAESEVAEPVEESTVSAPTKELQQEEHVPPMTGTYSPVRREEEEDTGFGI